MSPSLRELYESSPLSSAQAPYVEALHERFLADPASVPAEWRKFFEDLGLASAKTTRIAARPAVVTPVRLRSPPARVAPPNAVGGADAEKQSAVSRLIQFHANRGHLIADIDPLGLMQRPVPRVLELSYVGLTDADLETEFFTGSRSNHR